MGSGATSGIALGLDVGVSTASDEDLKGALAGLSEGSRKKLAENLAALEKTDAAAPVATGGAACIATATDQKDTAATTGATCIATATDQKDTKGDAAGTEAPPSKSQEEEAAPEKAESEEAAPEKAESVDSLDDEIDDLRKQIQEIQLVMVQTAQSITPGDGNPSTQPQRMQNVNSLMTMGEYLQGELDEKERERKEKKESKKHEK